MIVDSSCSLSTGYPSSRRANSPSTSRRLPSNPVASRGGAGVSSSCSSHVQTTYKLQQTESELRKTKSELQEAKAKIRRIATTTRVEDTNFSDGAKLFLEFYGVECVADLEILTAQMLDQPLWYNQNNDGSTLKKLINGYDLDLKIK